MFNSSLIHKKILTFSYNSDTDTLFGSCSLNNEQAQPTYTTSSGKTNPHVSIHRSMGACSKLNNSSLPKEHAPLIRDDWYREEQKSLLSMVSMLVLGAVLKGKLTAARKR